MSVIKYRPEVDGLRAVAVIPVVLFHLGALWVPGGFVGVDVFFVISGYLITAIILKEQSAGTFTFRGFWMRRVRRILPAMLAMLFVTGVASYFIMFGPAWKGIGEQVVSAIFIYANVEMWQLAGNYWGPAAENAPLLHTWSLSVEEQFYLFYPLLLLLLLKFVPKRTFALVLLGTAFSFAVGLYATKHSPSAAFYFLPPRAWELAAGCLLAIFERSRGPAPGGGISRSLAAAGLGLIIAGYFTIQGADGFPGFLALMPVVGSVLVIRYAGSEKCFAGSILSSSPMVYVGKCSYSLYLWHWPVIVLAAALEFKYPGSVHPVAVIAVVGILTLASYYFVEKPTRRMKGVLYPVAGGLIVSLGMAMTLQREEYDYDLSVLEPIKAYSSTYDIAPYPPTEELDRNGIIRLPTAEEQLTAYKEGALIRNYGNSNPEVVLIGSSHGLMWAPVIDEVCRDLEVSVGFMTVRSIEPIIHIPPVAQKDRIFSAEQRLIYDSQRLEKLEFWRPKLILISDRWAVRDQFERYKPMLEAFEKLGSKVIFIEQPPEIEVGDVSVPLYMAYKLNGVVPEEESLTYLPLHNETERLARVEELQDLSDEYSFVATLTVDDLYFAGENKVLVRAGGKVMYVDEDHLSYWGARRASSRFREAIRSLLPMNTGKSF